MPTRRGLIISVIALAVFGPGSSARATIDNWKSYKAAYPGKEPKAYSCKVCHLGAIGKKDELNGYGHALQQLPAPADPKKLTVEDVRAAESADPDGDGATTLQEVEAGTDPSDPASAPAGTIAPSGSAPPEASPVAESAPASAPPAKTRDGEQPSSCAPDVVDRLQAYLAALAGPAAWAAEPATPARHDAHEAPAESGQAEYVGTETCAACHTKQYQEFQQSTHARITVPEAKAQGCEMCHGPGSLHVAAGGGRGVGGIINPRKDPSTCFACHLDKKAEFRLPYHHPLMEGKVSCADCHQVHAPDVRPWSATSLKDINEACFKCHKDQRGPFVWEHEALREGCTTCHKVHGSIHDKMLLVRDNNLCLRCHTQVNFPTIGKSNHSSRLPQGTCFSAGCHTAVHGSNFDEHLRY